jgi:1-deoxy-D-xylulose-5-phosphate reductoisomerase
VYNAANEEAVAAFMDGRLSFTGIVDTIEQILAESQLEGLGNPLTLTDVLLAESSARERARALIAGAPTRESAGVTRA